MNLHQDNVIVITGAGRGLGRAYAERLASEGARVVIAEIDAGLAASIVPDRARLTLRWREGPPAWDALEKRLRGGSLLAGTTLQIVARSPGGVVDRKPRGLSAKCAGRSTDRT